MVDSLRHHLKVQKEKNIGFKAIAELKEYLYLCGVTAITETRLRQNGITHVLNTAVELKDFQYPLGDYNVDILSVEMQDKSSENLLNYVDECMTYIHNARQNGGKVLVHCVAGMSRSVSICLAYLVKYEHLTLKEAYDLIFYVRRFIYPNRGFWESLIEFEKQTTGTHTVELRPYICGLEIDVVEFETRGRIINGWMEDLFRFISLHLLIVIVQLIVLVIY